MASAGHGTASGFVRRQTVSAHNDATMRTVADFGEFGTLTLDEPVPHGGTGRGPSPLQAVLGALCGGEAVTFHRAAAELGLRYESLDFEAAFTIAIRGRQGGRSVRPPFQARAGRGVLAGRWGRVWGTAEPLPALAAVIKETEARCPVMNLLLDAKVDLRIEWVRDSGGTLETVLRC